MKFASSMKRVAAAGLVLLAAVWPVLGQNARLSNPDFESGKLGETPEGWFVPKPLAAAGFTAVLTDGQPRSGRLCAELRWPTQAPPVDTFSNLMQTLDAKPWRGKRIKVTAAIRVATGERDERAQMWLRVDRPGGGGAFDNIGDRPVRKQTWDDYSITAEVADDARTLNLGLMTFSGATAWFDHVRLEVLGDVEKVRTVLDSDHQFDGGSTLALKDLTKVQIENLATLGKVWGFLKYHHPRVTTGQAHWDYELFRVLPAILAAPDRSSANAALLKWIAGRGEVADPETPARLIDGNLHLRPDLDWIGDETLLGTELSQSLRSIHRHRLSGTQFYVSQHLGVGNPIFLHEPSYPDLTLPDAGFQLLSLYRFWNIIEYWSPYRDMLGEDWDAVLKEFIPKIAPAPNAETYQRELMALIAKAHDSHTNLWSSLQVRPPVGDGYLPVTVRFIENSAFVTGYQVADKAKAMGLEVGDILTDLDGVRVSKLVETWTPYYAASNDPARLRDIARSLPRGPRGAVDVRVRRGSETLELRAERLPPSSLNVKPSHTHDLPGETFRLLSEEVAYLKFSTVKATEAAHYVEMASGTKGLILDIRNYPPEFMVFALGSLLVTKATEFARFTRGDLSNPGAFHWTHPVSLSPAKPHYSGKVVVLLDETSQSQAEYTSMAFRAAGAKIVGSTTAGADGNVSDFALPGGLRSMISGIGVFYPDKKPTQRIGIIPDVEIKPTLAGMRAGRDEVLEEAVRQILEPDGAMALIEKLRKR